MAEPVKAETKPAIVNASVPRPKTIHPSRFRPHVDSHCWREWAVTPDNDHKIEDALRPEYWVHVTHLLTNGDIVHFRPDGIPVIARLVAVNVVKPAAGGTSGSARMELIEKWEQKDGVVPEQELYEDPQWCVGTRSYRVLRSSDRSVAGDFPSKKDAIDWIASNTKKRAA